MKETENYSFKKPDVKEFFELQTWSDNLDKIDQEIKNRELAQNESNEQIGKMKKISFDKQEEPEELVNGETVKSAFGKLAAAVKTLIIHKTLQATDAVLGHVKLSNSAAITEKGLYALDAVEKNATVDGTLAKKISELNDGLKNALIIKRGYYGTSGTSTPWEQDNMFNKTYHYKFKFPNVDGYKFLIGFSNISWTNGNNYFQYLQATHVYSNQEDHANIYSNDGVPEAPLYFVGIYIKS